MRLLWAAFLVGVLAGCAVSVPRSSTAPAVVPSVMTAADAALTTGDNQKALDLYRQLQIQQPTSSYYLAARLGEGESLEGLERWSEARDIYKSVYDAAVELQPEIAAQARYRLSFCYEALGDEVKAVATLLDSLRDKAHLPVEIGAAEIPARLAMLYGKAGDLQESMRYIEIAQKGIASLEEQGRVPASTLAKAYYEMGSVSMNQISTENFASAIAGQKIAQAYLFRAVGLKIEPWSQAAAEKLKKNFRDLWNILIEMPGVAGDDPESLARNQRRLQIDLGARFIDMVENAENEKPFSEKTWTLAQRELFTYLDELKKRAHDLVYQAEPLMDLTPESQKLNGLKRPGRIREAPRPPLPTSKDPNL